MPASARASARVPSCVQFPGACAALDRLGLDTFRRILCRLLRTGGRSAYVEGPRSHGSPGDGLPSLSYLGHVGDPGHPLLGPPPEIKSGWGSRRTPSRPRRTYPVTTRSRSVSVDEGVRCICRTRLTRGSPAALSPYVYRACNSADSEEACRCARSAWALSDHCAAGVAMAAPAIRDGRTSGPPPRHRSGWRANRVRPRVHHGRTTVRFHVFQGGTPRP